MTLLKTVAVGAVLAIVALILLERWTADRNARFNQPPHFAQPTWAHG